MPSASIALTLARWFIAVGLVRARLRELIDQLADKQMITRETLVAHELGQPAAAATAIKEKQRLLELDPVSQSVNVNINATFNRAWVKMRGNRLSPMSKDVCGQGMPRRSYWRSAAASHRLMSSSSRR